MTKRYLTIPVVVASLGLAAASTLAAEPQNNSQELADLKARIQKLEADQSKSTNETVTRVLQDSDKRSQLMQMEGFTSGWNNDRFQVSGGNGDFTLMPYFQMQFRTTTNYDSSGNDNTENGFSLPRVKLGFDGQIWRNFAYYFRWNSGNSDGGGDGALNLEQAFVRWQYSDQMAFKAGQFVDPVFHEQIVNSDSQLAGDRSLLNTIVTGADESYTQGVSVIFNPASNWNVELAFTDGVNTGNTDFRDFPTPGSSADFGFAGRVEFAANGTTNGYHDFTAMGNKEDSLVFGAGADWTQSGDTDNILHTVDVQWENGQGNLGIYAAFVGQFIRNGSGAGITGITGGAGGTDNDTYNWGFVAQAGYMMNENWELFGRYDYTHTDDPLAVGAGADTEDAFHEITGGVNYYFHGHHAKVTIDLTWLPNGAPAGAQNLGILTSDDDEFVLRGQFQLML
jgi:hypothetical protein